MESLEPPKRLRLPKPGFSPKGLPKFDSPPKRFPKPGFPQFGGRTPPEQLDPKSLINENPISKITMTNSIEFSQAAVDYLAEKYDLYIFDFDGVIRLDDDDDDDYDDADIMFFTNFLNVLVTSYKKRVAIATLNRKAVIMNYLTKKKLLDFFTKGVDHVDPEFVILNADHYFRGSMEGQYKTKTTMTKSNDIDILKIRDKKKMIDEISNNLNIKKESIVFYDDTEDNVKAVSNFGVDSIHLNSNTGFTLGVWYLQVNNLMSEPLEKGKAPTPVFYEGKRGKEVQELKLDNINKSNSKIYTRFKEMSLYQQSN